MTEIVAGSIVIALGVAHSVLGEMLIVGPLVANRSWTPRIPRAFAGTLVRFTWHAASLAWFGLAAVLLGAPAGVAFGAVFLLAGTWMLVSARRHPAWPLFLAAGLLGLDSADALPRAVLGAIVVLGIVVALAGSALHVAWAAGATAGRAHALPEDPATLEPLGDPGPILTLAVAGAAAALAVLIAGTAWFDAPASWWWVTAVAAVVATLRVVGDREHIGFMKTIDDTPFGRWDTRLYTPLFVVLAGAAVASLCLAGRPG